MLTQAAASLLVCTVLLSGCQSTKVSPGITQKCLEMNAIVSTNCETIRSGNVMSLWDVLTTCCHGAGGGFQWVLRVMGPEAGMSSSRGVTGSGEYGSHDCRIIVYVVLADTDISRMYLAEATLESNFIDFDRPLQIESVGGFARPE